MNKKQTGSAHVIIIALLVIALIGTLGFVYYQNFIQKKDSSVSKTDTDTSKTTEKSSEETTTKTESPAVAPAKVVNDFVSSYFSYITASATGHSDVAFANQSSALTDDFKAKMNSLTVATADHFLMIQNTPSSFTVGSASTTENSSSVPVTVNVGSDSTNIIYKLILVDNVWKINEVVAA